jgi:hypothetical protein
VIQRLLFVASLCLLPALARADVAPTETGAASEAGTAGASEAASDTDPETMPPVYEPCGCRSEQLGGGWSLALAALGVWALRRPKRRS